MTGRKIFAVGALVLCAALASTPVAQAGGQFTFSGTPGVSETHTWVDAGSGALLFADIYQAAGCNQPAPKLNDCADTILNIPAAGTLTLTTEAETPDDPAAADTDLELLKKNADGSYEQVDLKGDIGPVETMTVPLTAGTYVSRIHYALALEGRIKSTARFRAR